MGLLDFASNILGGGPLVGSSTSSTAPWEAQQPYLQQQFGEAQRLYGAPSPFLGQAAQMRGQRALAGSPLLRGAQAGLQDVISGAYLPGGERYNPMTEAIRREVMPAIDSRFAGAGRFGSGLHKIGLGEAITDRLARGAEAERGRMFQGLGMAPGLAQADYGDINQLMQAGMAPWQQLGAYQQALGAPISATQAQQTGGLLPGLSGLASFSFAK